MSSNAEAGVNLKQNTVACETFQTFNQRPNERSRWIAKFSGNMGRGQPQFSTLLKLLEGSVELRSSECLLSYIRLTG